MADDIDDAADSLSSVQSGGSLSAVRIGAVADDGTEVTVTLELPSGDAFEHAFTKPPVWGTNCELKRLLDHFELGPEEIPALEGKEVPCDREVGDDGLAFRVDVDALEG